jgi:hypothetical protein
MRQIIIAFGLLAVILPSSPASACYSWQIFTCSEGRPESTLRHLTRTRDEHRAVVARGVERVTVREVEQNLSENTRVFVLGTPEFPYRHWLHAGED